MARLYAYRYILSEQDRLQDMFKNLPINGKRTTTQTVKQIKNLMLDSSYRTAQRCNIIVSYPRMSIHGERVVFGEASIILPDCAIVNLEKLKEIEEGMT